MAVTSIWPIKGRVDIVINYAMNPEKTTEKSSAEVAALHQIDGVIQYAANEMKTETRSYVTCLNCTSEETAAAEFMETKRLNGKLGGRQCFHGYQSFKPGEVDAATAHEIGKQLAQKVWGDQFEVIVATHCNTGVYHNHFVLNSVSFVDGHHYHNTKEEYEYMRAVSDWLCKKYRLSVIENPEGKKKNHALYVAEKNGQPSFPKLIRADIDNAILATNTRAAFFDYLEGMGYQLRLYKKNGDWREQPSLRPPGAQRFFRFNTLGEDYSLEELELRIRRKVTKGEPFPEADREIVRQHRVKSQPPYRKHETGLSGLYVRYRFELGIIYKYPASVKRVSQFLREDIVKMEKLDAETLLLGKAQITTMDELLCYKQELQSKLDAAEQQRKDLRNLERSYARKHDPESAEQCSAEVAELTKEIKKLRKDIDLCDDIALRSAQTREELEWIIEQQEQERKENEPNELFRGCGGTGRENDFGRH